MKVKVAQSCQTLCDPIPVQGILQARTLEWVAFLSPGDLPNPGINLGSPALQADSLLGELPGSPLQSGRGLPNLVSPRFLAPGIGFEEDNFPAD